MRRLAGFALIVVSAWLIYHDCLLRLGGDPALMLARAPQAGLDPGFVLPAMGGGLGALGGIIIVCGGPGGAAAAMIGGVVAAGYSFYADAPLHVSGMRIWESDALVSLSLLFLSATAAVMARK